MPNEPEAFAKKIIEDVLDIGGFVHASTFKKLVGAIANRDFLIATSANDSLGGTK